MELNTTAWLARHAFATGSLADSVRASEPHFQRMAADPTEFAMVARFALHAGRVDLAKTTLDAVSTQYGGLIDHDVTGLRAGIAAVEDRTADALALYRSALAGYREMGCRFDVALTILDMAVLIGPGEPAVRASIPEGREILESLGARPLLDRLDAVTSSADPTAQPPTSGRSGTPAEASLER